MNRIEFFNSISGIQYPQMLVDFFDHFLALKQIVENSGKVTIPDDCNTNNNHIVFNIEFSNTKAKETVVNMIGAMSTVVIYNRPIYVNIVGVPVDKKSITLELF